MTLPPRLPECSLTFVRFKALALPVGPVREFSLPGLINNVPLVFRMTLMPKRIKGVDSQSALSLIVQVKDECEVEFKKAVRRLHRERLLRASL